jgi:Na+/melibiose symporter-like transporter
LKIEEEGAKKRGTGGRNWKAWLKNGSFYVHGMVYMLVRVAVNVTMTVQPFYLEKALLFKGNAVQPTPIGLAAVPLGSYITSLIFSIYF